MIINYIIYLFFILINLKYSATFKFNLNLILEESLILSWSSSESIFYIGSKLVTVIDIFNNKIIDSFNL